MLTLGEKRKVCRHIKATYGGARRIRFESDGQVTAYVDHMPNTNKPGRIFCGWGKDLLYLSECFDD